MIDSVRDLPGVLTEIFIRLDVRTWSDFPFEPVREGSLLGDFPTDFETVDERLCIVIFRVRLQCSLLVK
jgi:hypothetical protein